MYMCQGDYAVTLYSAGFYICSVSSLRGLHIFMVIGFALLFKTCLQDSKNTVCLTIGVGTKGGTE